MAVGNDVAIFCQNKAGTGRGALGYLAVYGALDVGCNGNHLVYIVGIDLGGRQDFPGIDRETDSTLLSVDAADLVLQTVHLLGKGFFHLMDPALPAAVDHCGRNAAAACNQYHHQNGGQQLFPETADLLFLSGRFLRSIGIILGSGLILGLMIHDVRRVRIGGLFTAGLLGLLKNGIRSCLLGIISRGGILPDWGNIVQLLRLPGENVVFIGIHKIPPFDFCFHHKKQM